ncbi:prolyl oligopeptidase family serine peptidase [bacterium]|nr:prolyl oligopeptidase family serine peptidase [bacterium]
MVKRTLALLLLLAGMSLAGQADPFEEAALTYTGGPYKAEVFRYRILRPAAVEAGRTYPLIFFLHGAGERGDENRNQLKYLPEQMAKPEMRERYPCFLIAPQCRKGKQWVNAPWGAKESTPIAEKPSHQLQVAIAIVQKAMKDLPIDKSRVYLTGLSMGGYGAWELAMRHPEWFACVAALCGGGDERQAKRLVGLPIWAFHGSKDNVVRPVRSQVLVEAIRKAGGTVKYTELDGHGHGIWNPVYRDPKGVVPWMFEQTRK